MSEGGIAFFLSGGHEQPVTIEFHQGRDFRRLHIVRAACRCLPDENGCFFQIVGDITTRAHLDQSCSEKLRVRQVIHRFCHLVFLGWL